jgi:hypothetical protein
VFARSNLWLLNDPDQTPLLNSVYNIPPALTSRIPVGNPELASKIERSVIIIGLDLSRPESAMKELEEWETRLDRFINDVKGNLSGDECSVLENNQVLWFQHYTEPVVNPHCLCGSYS